MAIRLHKQLKVGRAVDMLFSQPPGFECILQMLRQNGYAHNCSLQGEHIYCCDKRLLLHQHEFVINDMFYFPPAVSVRYEQMIYTIEAIKISFRATLLLDAEVHGSVFSVMINQKLQESVSRQRKIFDQGIL